MCNSLMNLSSLHIFSKFDIYIKDVSFFTHSHFEVYLRIQMLHGYNVHFRSCIWPVSNKNNSYLFLETKFSGQLLNSISITL